MKLWRLAVMTALVFVGSAMGGESDGPYILVYREHFDYSITAGTMQICSLGTCGQLNESREPIAIEHYPTLEKALAKLNERKTPVFQDDNGQNPQIGKNDLILLVKGKAVGVDVTDSGRKVRVSHSVWKTEDVPVQEWDVKP